MTTPADDGVDAHGRDADRPASIPARGWKDVLVRTRQEVKDDRVPLLAAGVAFYALLAMVPALVAVVSLYGLVAEPDQVVDQARSWLGAAPQEVRDLVTTQLQSITSSAGAKAGLALVVGVLVALWSASSGMNHLIEAIDMAYDEDETRGFVKRRGLALLFTLGAIVFVLFAVGVIAVLPGLLDKAGLGTVGRVAIGVIRWVVLLAGMLGALALLYRYAPDRDEPKWSWTSPGALVATVVWLVGSALFAVYAGNFGKYNETYGSLGAVVVLMLWLWLTAMCVVIGAELNAESERQTARDTTTGPEQPMGTRDAEAADTLGATADEVRAGRSASYPSA